MKKKFWIVNQVNSFTAEILLYGYIGEYEAIDDAAFIADLRGLEQTYTHINIRVNCGGGDVYKGLAIFNAIRNSKAIITGFVDGIAASMGAVIIAACKYVQMSKYARYMTHRVSGGCFGTADEMRDYAAEMEQLETIIASIIARRTGITEAEAKEKYITNKDRWIGAEQALEEKLIDGIYDADPVQVPDTENSAQQLFNAYHQVFNISTSNQTDMKFIAVLLGLPENATEAEITAAINKLKQEKEAAENKLTAGAKARAKTLIDGAITNKQLVEADRANFEPMAEANYEATAAMIAKIPGVKKPGDLLNIVTPEAGSEGAANEITTWEQLTAKDEAFVAEFKKNNGAKFNELFRVYQAKPLETKA